MRHFAGCNLHSKYGLLKCKFMSVMNMFINMSYDQGNTISSVSKNKGQAYRKQSFRNDMHIIKNTTSNNRINSFNKLNLEKLYELF